MTDVPREVPDVYPPETEEETRRLDPERKRIRDSVADITFAWAEVENAMVAVLVELVNQGPMGDVASAIFFAVQGLDARISIVEAAFVALFERYAPTTDELIVRWKNLTKATREKKRTRNVVAHGQMTTLWLARNNKRYVRLTYPLSAVGKSRTIFSRGEVPGLSASDLESHAVGARKLATEFKIFAPIVGQSREFQTFLQALPQKLAELEGLRRLRPHIENTQTPEGPQPPPRSSVE